MGAGGEAVSITDTTAIPSVWVVKATEQVSGDYDLVFYMGFSSRAKAMSVCNHGKQKAPELHWEWDAMPFDALDFAYHCIEEVSEGFYRDSKGNLYGKSEKEG